MATKAAKSITINATKYELANTLAVNDGKVQLKAKDVLLDEAELPAGGKFIAITLVRDSGSDVGNTRRAYLIDSIETSDNIDPTTYTGQDMANDFLAGGLKIVAFVPSNGWSDNSYIEISELNVFDNTEGQTPNFYYELMGAGLSTAVGNDTVKYKLSVDGLSTADTLDTLENGYHHASLYNCLDAWVTPPKFVVVEATLTSDMAINQIGISAGWRGMSFTGRTFNEVVSLFGNTIVYISLKGSTNKLTAFAPLTLTRRFAADMWSPTLSFVADGSVFDINDTPEIKRITST